MYKLAILAACLLLNQHEVQGNVVESIKDGLKTAYDDVHCGLHKVKEFVHHHEHDVNPCEPKAPEHEQHVQDTKPDGTYGTTGSRYGTGGSNGGLSNGNSEQSNYGGKLSHPAEHGSYGGVQSSGGSGTYGVNHGEPAGLGSYGSGQSVQNNRDNVQPTYGTINSESQTNYGYVNP